VPKILCNNIPIFKTAEALSAYSFFFEVSAPGLVNFGSYTFWNRLVLQAGYDELSIKHLIVAVSTLDMQQRQNVKNPQEAPLYVLHHGRALQQLTKAANPDIGVMLIACLLFIVCDDMLQNQQSALQHILAARGILQEYYKKPPNVKNRDTVEELSPIFQRLSMQTGELDQQTLPYHTRWPYCTQLNGFTKPSVFEQDFFQARSVFEGYASVEQASQCLQSLVSSCLAPQPPWKAPASRFHMVPDATALLNQWLSYFDSMCNRMDRKEASAKRVRLHILRTYHLALSVMSRCAPFGEESLYDQYFGQFEHLSTKIGFFLAYNAGDLPDMGERMLCVLFFIAAHYRNVATRRTTVWHLRQCGWSGIRLAFIAEKIIELEEKGFEDAILAVDIPEWNRVRALDINFPSSIVERKPGSTLCILRYSVSPYDGCHHAKSHAFEWDDVGDSAVQSSIVKLLERMVTFQFPEVTM
jgi:hypothetical protein